MATARTRRRTTRSPRRLSLPEAFRLANNNRSVRSAAGTINVVVYDRTETDPPPGFGTPPRTVGRFQNLDPRTLTFWWRAGGVLQAYRGQADVLIGANSWESALRRLNREVASRGGNRRVRIGNLQFWGHGLSGKMFIAGEALKTADFRPGSALHPALRELAGNMHRTRGSVWFRGCQTFRGSAGKTFARTAADFFNVPVVGHTYIIWMFQSGTSVLRPGRAPTWSDREGTETPRSAQYSLPRKPRTITCLRFSAPQSRSDYVTAADALRLAARLLT